MSILAAAVRRKLHQTCPTLPLGRCVGVEVGGRFSTEALQLLRVLARHKAPPPPDLPRPLRGSHAYARLFASALR